MLVRNILKYGIRASGAGLDSHEEPSAQDYDDALGVCNAMLATWSAKSVVLENIVVVSKASVASQSAYTIGASGDFNTGRTHKIVSGYLRDANNYDTAIKPIELNELNSIYDKTYAARPEKFYYDGKYFLGTIYFEHATASGYTIYLNTQQQMTALADLDSESGVSPETESAIYLNLALRLASFYGVSVPPETVGIAHDAFLAVAKLGAPCASFSGLPGVRGSLSVDINAG